MNKSPTQEKLEAQRKKPIKTIICGVLDGMRGERNIPNRASADLGVSQATFYQWCRQWDINLDDYRQPAEETANV